MLPLGKLGWDFLGRRTEKHTVRRKRSWAGRSRRSFWERGEQDQRPLRLEQEVLEMQRSQGGCGKSLK